LDVEMKYKTILNKKIKMILIILLCLSLFGIVNATTTTPPSSVIFTGYITSHNQTGVWWQNPVDYDFAGTQMWFDNVYMTTLSSTTKFYYRESLSIGYHTFSTHTIDATGNINPSWENITIYNDGSCSENWNLTSPEWCEPPSSTSFNQNISQGFVVLPVQFTDTSTGNPKAWNWSFGDGTFSNDQNPIHYFSNGGNYSVTLYSWNTNTTRTSYTSYTDVWNHTTNDFSADVTMGSAPLFVTFTETSYNATSWYWEFGDGGISYVQNPTHQYLSDGVYSVNHSSSNAHETYWTNKTDYITVSTLHPYPPASITNLVGHEENCISINWTWDNPTEADYFMTQVWIDNIYMTNVTEPTNFYLASPLTDNISHTISTRTISQWGVMNSTWVNDTVTLSSCPFTTSLVANFTINQNDTCIPSDVTLTSTTYHLFPIISYQWNVTTGGPTVDFTTENVDVVYITDGGFTINLTVTDNTGNTSTKFGSLSVYNCTIPVTPTKVPGNVSQQQVPAQTAKNYTDIRLWAGVLILTLICMIITRNTKFNTLRPAIFGAISFITATASIWMSLSIAYMGDFALGAIVQYSNETTKTAYYYQVIQVVANTQTTIICIIIFVFVILNLIDIAMNYIQKGADREEQEAENKRERFKI
jgi:PKD repeat protein